MQDSKKIEWIQKLISIQNEGKLGELIERFSYARREVADYDVVAYTHAKLDAENLGRAAGLLLAVDADVMAEVALEAVVPDRIRQLGEDLIDEMVDELAAVGQPVAVVLDSVPSQERSLAW